MLKATTDSYGKGPEGETRFKYLAVKVFPRSLAEEDTMLLKRLGGYQHKKPSDEDHYMRD